MRIIPYEPQYAPYFESLNKAWLQKYFHIEPVDEYVLTHPEEAIINKGGGILFAEHEGQIIGTIAWQPHGEGEAELIKMGVDESYQGLGAGKQLFEAAMNAAIAAGARRIVLYSNRGLAPALSIYAKFGFTEIPVESSEYERCNIKLVKEV